MNFHYTFIVLQDKKSLYIFTVLKRITSLQFAFQNNCNYLVTGAETRVILQIVTIITMDKIKLDIKLFQYLLTKSLTPNIVLIRS